MPKTLFARTLDRLYPPVCVLCGAAGHAGLDLCPGCLADLPHNGHCCFACALPLPATRAAGTLCGECLRRPPPFTACYTAFRYEYPLNTLIAGAKFRSRLNLARLLGLTLARYLLQREADMPELVIPVPLHPKRLQARGYNQALEMGRATAGVLSLPLEPRCCTRVLVTAPQASLERKARQRNVRGAFSARNTPPAKHVAILDDVITTGSTAAELTRVLLKQGVERVDVWAVARTP